MWPPSRWIKSPITSFGTRAHSTASNFSSYITGSMNNSVTASWNFDEPGPIARGINKRAEKEVLFARNFNGTKRYITHPDMRPVARSNNRPLRIKYKQLRTITAHAQMRDSSSSKNTAQASCIECSAERSREAFLIAFL